MSGLDDLFQTRENVELSYAARVWIQRIRAGEKAKVEVIRKRSGLSYGPARLSVVFDGKDPQPDEWDTQLSEALASEKVAAVSEDNEALRLSLMLTDWFQYAAQRFGDDYFNCVLVEYVKDQMGTMPEIEEVLRHIHESSPYRGSDHYADCRNEVEAVLQRAAHMLSSGIGYPRPAAVRILVRAVAQFLDDRFGVTNRRMLGML